VRYVLEYALVIAWVIAIAAGCFTAGLLIGRSAAESGSYGIYVLLSAVVTTAAIVTAVFLSITSVSRARRRTNSRS
jgi:heme/copper-type cytochrome/quinol oxidase subunit 2